MGGWRCTFRNCSAAADGKTHVFHYPVFDKVRCLKWLTNAGRLEFLNLKLSQLKNRVVCQHHFKDECFMNYKKDKLTFVAVPTENGSLSFIEDSIFTNDAKITLPITFEDIENSETRSLTAREKKANHSIIYADFLTDPIIHSADNIPEPDCDIKPQKPGKDDDFISLKVWSRTTHDSKPAQEAEKDDDFISFKMWSHETYASKPTQETSEVTTSQSVSQTLNNPANIDKISFHIEIDPRQDVLNILEATPNNVDNLNSNKQLSEDIVSSSQINLTDKTDALFNNCNIRANPENKIVCKSNNKIKIISEKTLTVPFPVAGTFESVCPTGILNPRKRKVETELTNKENSLSSTVKNEPQVPKLQNSEDPMEHHKSPTKPNLLEQKNKTKIISPPNKIQKGNMVSYSKSPNKAALERIAAIEEKRTFNKKLRDMIEFCLDDKEENIKTFANMKSTKISPTEKESKTLQQPKNSLLHKQSEKITAKSTNKNLKKEMKDKEEIKSTVKEKQVIRSSENKVVLPDYKLSVLEAKLSRMESLLLKKVGENTQRIDNLRQTLSKSNNFKKRSIQTHTMQDTELHKKQLFHEISEYLSPDLNSLIYEELFMKEFETKTPNKTKVGSSPMKRQPR